MEVIQKVKNTIKEHELIREGTRVVVGFSGGPDSLCLLSVLQEIKKEFFIQIFAVHVNHQLRGEAADRDQAFVERVCASMQIPCKVVSCDVGELAKKEGLSTEDAGRRVRYQAFFEEKKRIEEELKRQNSLDDVVIAVAQNQNDQAETIIMRIMRGTGLDGLIGIEYKRKDGVIRPLLDVSREEIEQYCNENHLNPCIDHTNLQTVYTRNRIRLELIPYMEQYFNQNVIGALTRLSKIVSEDASYLNDEAKKAWNYCQLQSCKGDKIDMQTELTFVDLKRLQQQPAALRKRILLLMLKEKGLFQNVSAVHLEHADHLIQTGSQPSTAEFPNGYRLRIAYDKVGIVYEENFILKNKKNDKTIYMDKQIQENALNGELKEKLVKWEDVPNLKKMEKNKRAFDYNAVKATGMPLVLRTRKPGDFLRPFGMKGTKKLQNYFVDRKIPKELRDKIPLVACGSEILWIIGEATNENYKVTEKSEVILLLEYDERI
ncbi:tRNA lysidine(34) synthetase TilS [Anaerovorax sp. IOR16]|uniref:tRNA lysidine(34) synthetase TilS n=1 Tax=Anaerovorax sp. IOR16 TaxID=2773458 RepID=UPI0019D14D14|nr:tRNA lysidine(34) synthetase TilS [Anaerovorax sp. IOR16]